MKISINNTELNGAVSTVTRALPTKPQLGILEGIELIAKDNALLLRCSDLTIEIESRLAAAVDEEGEVIVQGKLFAEIIRKMPAGEIYMVTDGDTMKISSGKAKASLQALTGENFPLMAADRGSDVLRIPQGLLKDMVNRVSFSVAIDSPKAVLTGINVLSQDNMLTIAALDGYRLAIREARIDSLNKQISCTVPAKPFNDIIRLLNDSADEVSLLIGATHMTVELEDTVITVRLIDEEYLNYRKMVPVKSPMRARVNTKDFLEACERASLLASTVAGISHIVKFKFFEDKLLLNAATELGRADEELDIVMTGGTLEISFNARYLIDALKNIEDEEFYFDLPGNRNACLLKPLEDDRYNYIVVPINRG